MFCDIFGAATEFIGTLAGTKAVVMMSFGIASRLGIGMGAGFDTSGMNRCGAVISIRIAGGGVNGGRHIGIAQQHNFPAALLRCQQTGFYRSFVF